ncbi:MULTISPECIES: hypothetical protein [Nitrosopumilus]|jgi:hypothetical protein|uniref:Uncharacterized protein n=1 Tax=Nitrosopumilus zosterae TaxID=718286 RepID=A0A2S2KQL6_9ARCH|nr:MULTISPECIES: hypothetical protein [Nitrosopumilus]MCV0366449.1 hypothetical protein [Nitrosopumilus sp.]MCV0410350.1 hypothetical protein [Nitrosopumilus sp.]BDQ31614.1 hypothetical protein NZOSNM25_001738 [Nitrosopumilus zosterae]GBH33821.1 hypothetical protein NZNM25_06120 [Nitrosopumilus zosterae]
MGKIRIRTGRGTGTIEVDDDPSKWSGDEYRKIQEARKKAAANRMVHTGRGTGSRKLGDMPDPKARPSTEGMTRVTGRGTSSRKSTNKGSK